MIGRRFTNIAAHLTGLKEVGQRSWWAAADRARSLLQPDEPRRLVILDDIFPHLLSAFRIAEYNTYLDSFPLSEVRSTAAAFPLIEETRDLGSVVAEYATHFPEFGGRVSKFNPHRRLPAAGFYTIFLNNAYFFLDFIEKHKVPFVFTLYPGGGFQLGHNVDSDTKLRRVCSSPNLRTIITTQTVTTEYLLFSQMCDPQKVEFIYGGIHASNRIGVNVDRKLYGEHKDSFDICFVAYKYTERGVDKGYDIFVQVARLLARTHPDMRFHVVGNFYDADIDVSDIQNRFLFWGPRRTEFFTSFHSSMDLILSPNVPFVLQPGAFDGFPTGACTEAALCGVPVFCTDPLELNIAFEDRREIVIISRDPVEIRETIIHYYRSYDDLRAIGERGRTAFRRVFDIHAQMQPRLSILRECMIDSPELR